MQRFSPKAISLVRCLCCMCCSCAIDCAGTIAWSVAKLNYKRHNANITQHNTEKYSNNKAPPVLFAHEAHGLTRCVRGRIRRPRLPARGRGRGVLHVVSQTAEEKASFTSADPKQCMAAHHRGTLSMAITEYTPCVCSDWIFAPAGTSQVSFLFFLFFFFFIFTPHL